MSLEAAFVRNQRVGRSGTQVADVTPRRLPMYISIGALILIIILLILIF